MKAQTHFHRCRACGATWEHPDRDPPETLGEFCEARKSHACPGCGEFEYIKYYPDPGEGAEYPWKDPNPKSQATA